MALELNQICKIAPGVRLQYEKVQNAWVLLYPEGMVNLGETAGDILRQLDGERSVAEVIAALEGEYGAAPELQSDVLEFLAQMIEGSWVKVRD